MAAVENGLHVRSVDFGSSYRRVTGSSSKSLEILRLVNDTRKSDRGLRQLMHVDIYCSLDEFLTIVHVRCILW